MKKFMENYELTYEKLCEIYRIIIDYVKSVNDDYDIVILDQACKCLVDMLNNGKLYEDDGETSVIDMPEYNMQGALTGLSKIFE